MKKLILHIGTGKTGSTALQESLSFAYQNNALRSVCYPNLLGKRHHNELCTLVMPHERIRRDIRSRYPEDNADYQKFMTSVRTAFVRDVMNHETVLLSGEFFCGFNAHEAKEFVQILRQLDFAEIHVLVYFREPASLYLSQVQQRLKASASFNEPHSFLYDYLGIINCWQGLVTSFTVREFDRTRLKNGDILDDYLAFVNTTLNKTLTVPDSYRRSMNESLSAASMALLQDFRRQFYTNRDDFFDASTVALVKKLPEIETLTGVEVKPRLRAEVIQCIRFNHAKQIEMLRKRFGFAWETVDHPVELVGGYKDVRRIIDYTERDEEAYKRMCLQFIHAELSQNDLARTV